MPLSTHPSTSFGQVGVLWPTCKIPYLSGSKQKQQGFPTSTRPPIGEPLQTCRPMLQAVEAQPGSNRLPQPTRHTQSHSLYNKQERTCMEKVGSRRSLGAVGVLWGQVPLSAMVYYPHLCRGFARLYPGALAYKCILAPITGAHLGPEQREQLESIRQHYVHPASPPGHLKHLIGPSQPGKTTWHTQPTQWLLFQDLERQLFCLIHINKQKVKQNDKTEEYLQNEETKISRKKP